MQTTSTVGVCRGEVGGGVLEEIGDRAISGASEGLKQVSLISLDPIHVNHAGQIGFLNRKIPRGMFGCPSGSAGDISPPPQSPRLPAKAL